MQQQSWQKNDIDTLEKLESYVDLLDKQMNELLVQRKIFVF